MTSLEEVKQSIQLGLDDFQRFIKKSVKKDEKFLIKTYANFYGQHKTILNHLIELDNDQNNLFSFISFLLEAGADPNLQEPVHLIVQLQKWHLISLFFENKKISLNYNVRDKDGKTLIYRVIEAKNVELLLELMQAKINIFMPSQVQVCDEILELQPLHQAIISNLPRIVKELLKEDAPSTTLFGRLRESPSLLAARLGYVDVLDVLLQHSNYRMEHERNRKQQSAIDLMTSLIKDKTKKTEAVRGVAILICRGHEVPHDLELRKLIIKNRKLFWEEVDRYTDKFPELFPPFIRRCKNKNEPLHQIIFARSWSFYGLFGFSDDLMYKMLAKVDKSTSTFDEDEIKFAEFSRHYVEVSKSSIFSFFRQESTYSKIADGEILDIHGLKQHLTTNHENLPKEVLEQIEGVTSPLHKSLDLEKIERLDLSR